MTALRSRSRQGLPIGQASLRGFTLVELVAVVVIIAVFASLAIPSVVVQLRDRRMQEAARSIAIVYREARLRALGRGSAVLVRFAGGGFDIREAHLEGACVDLPASSCVNTTWGALTGQRSVGGFRVATGGESTLAIALRASDDTPLTTLDVCFTPMGRAFSRRLITDGAPFTPLTETFVASVSRAGVTRTREVVLMPNGTARMFTP